MAKLTKKPVPIATRVSDEDEEIARAQMESWVSELKKLDASVGRATPAVPVMGGDSGYGFYTAVYDKVGAQTIKICFLSP